MRRPGLSLGAVAFAGAAVAVLPLAARVVRSWPWRVAVEGHSMEPTLRAGDWLLVDPLAHVERPVQAGELVVARDPRSEDRWLIKRVAEVLPDSRLSLAADHPAHAGDELPPVEQGWLVGRPWLRYWPLRRLGRPA